jgi:hypothetical protein
MPVISFMPYFPNRIVNETYGAFTIWNWDNHKADYVSDLRMRDYLDKYFSIYKKPNGETEDRIAVISTTQEGALPEKLDGIKQRVGRFAESAMLAHLVTLPADSTGGLFATSSDNFVVLFQPFDIASEAVAIQSGSYVKTQWTAGNFAGLHFATPQYIPNPGVGVGDETLLIHLAGLCSNNSNEVERIFRSLYWVRSAFTNTDGHPYEARIVAMATAFEILLDVPEKEKGRHFSQSLNALLPPNKLPHSQKMLGAARNKKTVNDNDVGWWCRDFYDLRSSIVHGDEIQNANYFTNDVEKLRIALYLFIECVWGMLRKIDNAIEFDGLAFWIRADKWMNPLKLEHEAFY